MGEEDLISLVSAERGHYLFESGYHGTRWMDLETLFLEPRKIEPFATRLAARLDDLGAEVVCGPLVEGAFVALEIARNLNLPFTYSERYERDAGTGLYPFGYRIPRPLQQHLRGRRVLLVNDVISAGSAVRGTAEELRAIGARCVAIAALLMLGDWAAQYASQQNLELVALATQPNEMWSPAECPLCLRGVPLERRIQSM
jgi:orotate phosphoribosyltransferase